MLKEKVLDTILQFNMIRSGDKVIVAVSGGPDSMCLLDILLSLRESLNISIFAAHVNHCLRGLEADLDEQYVREYCMKNNIEFFSKSINIEELAKSKGVSCETCGREERYAFFKELLIKLNADKVALAHNANDRAETTLMRIMRGTGVEGLLGIKPIRDCIYIRPIINVYRDEIEAYCLEKNLNPRIDKTNLQAIFTRNKIRLELIPYIKKNFNEDFMEAINRLSENAYEDNSYLEKIVQGKYKTYCDKTKEKVIIYNIAFKEPMAILSRIIRKAIEDLKGDTENIEKVHINNIIKLQQKDTGLSTILPSKINAYNDYGNIVLSLYKEQSIKEGNKEYDLNLGKNYIKDLNLSVCLKLLDSSNNMLFKGNQYTKYFDYNVDSEVKLRFRREGDKFTPFGMKGSKKLKDFFIDLKISREERDKTILITFGDEIAWVFPYRTSEKFRISKESKRVLQITIEREESNE